MLEIKTLDKNFHDRQAFDCGVAELNQYLHEQANHASKRYLSRTKVLTHIDNPSVIIGFHTLSYTELFAPTGSKLYQKYPHPLPALLLSRMAVDKNFHGNRFGEQLLLDVIFQVARMELEGLSMAPVVGLFVDAKTTALKSFYVKYGFVAADPLQHPNRMWIPVDTCIRVYQQAFGV